jgi:hypothetical protein
MQIGADDLSLVDDKARAAVGFWPIQLCQRREVVRELWFMVVRDGEVG